MDVDTRGFAWQDAGAVVDLWNLSLPYDPTTGSWFRDCVLLDPNFDPAGLRLAFDGERLAGCAYGVRRLTPLSGADLEPDAGWIPFFFVDPDYRGRGIGARLLGEAVDFLRAAGRTRIEFASYTPNYVLPGIDADLYPAGLAMLRAAGFAPVQSPVAMARSLTGYAAPADVRDLRARRAEEGYAFREPLDGELPDLIRFATAEFNPDWGEAIRAAVRHGIPRERLVIARRDGIEGLAMYGAYRGVPERFGPFGVLARRRGTGLGKILLHETMTRMRAEGLHSSWFLWTGERSPAAHLYAAAGYSITRRFHIMRAA